MRWLFTLIWLALVLTIKPSLQAQTPRLLLRFDGSLTDSSGAAVVTSVTASPGFTPAYGADRNGAANGAIVFTGGQSLTLAAASLPGNSNQALGLRNAAGTNTSFTLCAWVCFTSLGSGQDYSTVFGNAGGGAGTLHAGLNSNSDRTHFGFDGSDANGGPAAVVANQWYHLAFVYDTTLGNAQRIYVNGIPDVTRNFINNTLKVADLMIGNWGTATSATNDFKGLLDDVAVYNTALKGDQILALANGVNPATVPVVNSYFAPPTRLGYRGTAGMWGVREIRGYPGIGYTSLVNIDRVLKAHASAPAGTVADYWVPAINFSDDQAPGTSGNFLNDADFGTDTPGDDNNFLCLARCSVKIPVEGNYTFGFRGDEGGRLRVVGKRFTSSTRLSSGNPADPAHISDMIVCSASTLDSHTLGVVNLPAGEVDLEFTYWEGSGSASVEVFAALGAKTSFDGTFQLVGNTTAGGLEIVRDSDTVPSFTVNNGTSLFVHGGVPANLTLAWNVVELSTALSIDNGIGPVANSGTLTLPVPSATTTYTITATTGADVATKTVTVYVDSPPVASISAADTTVTPGAPVLVSWNVQGASSLTLNPGNANVTGASSLVVNPTATTTYTLTASNGAGSTSASVTITVGSGPLIQSFSASDTSPMYGKDVQLSWTVTGADTQSIDQSIGTVSASGSLSVIPLATTVYTITATNIYGSITSSITVTLPVALGVAAPGFSARRVSATTPLPFSGQSYLESALNLLGGQNAGTSTTGGPYGTINFSDGADGDYTSGNTPFPGGTGDNFAVEITGTLVVNTPGEYTFMVNSDDGCRLRIDGKDVILDDATHNPTSASGSVVLYKPTATFELVYYDATGGAEVEVSWVRPNLSWQQLGVAIPAAPIIRGGLVLSEFVASGSTLADEDGRTGDWIEVWNSSTEPVSLEGHYLTNNATTLGLWAFPSKTLAPNEFLLVFASGKNRRDPVLNLHTGFTLSGSGGYLALTRNNGAGGYTVLTEFNPYPDQTPGQSYGSSDAEGYVGSMEVPTPGGPNAASYAGFVQAVTFSHARGRYSAPFSLALNCATPGATIRYSLDGAEPTTARGTLYTGPITVSGTAVVRARAFIPGWQQSAAVTHSYLFPDDVVLQNTAYVKDRGWPLTPVNGQVYRYGMNLAAVTSAGGDLNALKAALAAAPSVCMNLNPEDFHGSANGIYSNPGKRGRFWERPASLEVIEPDGTTSVQKDCGVRIRGNSSRGTNNPKHAFHLFFRSLYGGDLVYPLFGSEGTVKRFDQIDMRCEQHNSWSSNNSANNAMIREQFARKTQGDMGQPYARGAYFHLYINGIYWGVFDWQEKGEADFAANLFGGTDTDYDTAKSAASTGSYNTEMTDGNFIAWRQLFDLCLALKNAGTEADRTALYLQMQGLNPDGSPNPAFPVLLDADNLIDSELVFFYDGSYDAPISTYVGASNNWFAIRRRDGTGGGWKFFHHDHEWALGFGSNSYNRVGPWGDPNATVNNWGQSTTMYRNRENFAKFHPHYLHEFLCFSAEYRQRVSDRAHRHLLGSGALSTAACLARVAGLAARIDPIIHAEAARWGSTTLNKNSWLSAKASIDTFIQSGGTPAPGQTAWMSQPRTNIVLEQLRGYTDNGIKPLFYTISDPVFSGQSGGLFLPPYQFSITNPGGEGILYYTLDGSDPRDIGGGIRTGALTGASPVSLTLTSTMTVSARIYNSSSKQWSGLTTQNYIAAQAPSTGALVISELHYNPAPAETGTEFVELMNISTQSVLLGGSKFTSGITFTFPAGTILAAGARCVLVEDPSAFALRHPTVPASQILGQYSGSLSNGGETLLLQDSSGSTLLSVTYDDVAPWPLPPDGTGPSLVLIRPETNPNPNVPTNWRSSAFNGGSPGTRDTTTFLEWQSRHGITDSSGLGDLDQDGLADLLEYGLGTDPGHSNPSGLIAGFTEVLGESHMTLTVTRPMGLEEVTLEGQAGTSLDNWGAAVLLDHAKDFVTGTETLVWRHPQPAGSSSAQFMRVRISR